MYQHSEVSRQIVNLLQTTSPSHEVIEVLTIELGSDPSLSEIKASLRLLDSFVSEEVRIPRPYSDFDCTGQHFTSDLERISRTIKWGMDKKGYNDIKLLVAVYFHHISIDV